jgi:hypothetical protein
MTPTVCLAIGVGDAPPLDYLRGAVNGAHGVASWAKEQQFPTKLLTDEEDPVEPSQVAAALAELLATAPEALVLYFAGHGLSRGAGDDLWLLSRWHKEYRAILVNVLRDRLSCHGLKRLILISDACRSPVDCNSQGIDGVHLLDRGPFEEHVPQMDIWYSASPGRAAFMIPGNNPQGTRCLFSGLLTEALAGGHAAAFDASDPARPITSFSLADFLEHEVPARANYYGATLRPVINTAIRPPRNRYRSCPPAVVPTFPPWPEPSAAQLAAMGDGDGSRRIAPPAGASWTTRRRKDEADISFGAPRPAPETIFAAATLHYTRSLFAIPLAILSATLITIMDLALWSSLEFGVAALFNILVVSLVASVFLGARAVEILKRDSHLKEIIGVPGEGGMPGVALPPSDAWRDLAGDFGLTASGAKISNVLTSGAARLSYRRGGSAVAFDLSWPRDGSSYLEHSLDLLVLLSNGCWTGNAIVPNLVLSLDVGPAGVQKAVYRNRDEPPNEASELMMAQFARRGIEGDQALEVVEALRRAKHADPMLGVIAAWLHHMQGDLDNIRRTAFYFACKGQPVPFDIALLGRLQATRLATGGVQLHIPAVEEAPQRSSIPPFMREATGEVRGHLAGSFPFLRQGWAILDPDGRPGLYPAGLAELAGHLRPAPFTTLDGDGGRRLAALIFPGR